MKSNIDQLMKEALEDHRKGNFENAEKLYREILETDPTHIDANHNLGVILVANHNSSGALTYFQCALESNENVEQIWLSYIDALINIDELNDARQLIEAAREKNLSHEKLDIFLERTLTPIELHEKGKFFRAQDGRYLNFLKALHKKKYDGYFEIGTRTGASLVLSQSPSVAIDPYFQLSEDPIGNKDFCLLFQETSDSFFQNSMSKLLNLRCQLAFIDGMHLFECALRDFINLAKISAEKSLFLFHDPIPWTYRMATRNNEKLGRNEAWTGDIWKLVHILSEVGMKDGIKLLSSAPSGLLAVLNPEEAAIKELEKNYDYICSKWLNVDLNRENLLSFYEVGIFEKPEIYLDHLEKSSFGCKSISHSRDWVSQ